MKKEKRGGNEMFVLLPDGTREDASIHLPILEAAELSPDIAEDRRVRLTKLGLTLQEIETHFDKG